MLGFKAYIKNFDVELFRLINGFAKKSSVLDFFAIFSAVYLGPLLFAVLAGAAIFFRDIELFLVPFSAAAVARFIVNEIVYHIYKRKRPLEILDVQYLIKKPNHPALPSGHAAAFFALSFALLPLHFTLGIVFIIATSLVALSRIFCGVHWPSDVIAGILSAVLSATVVYIIRINMLTF